VSTCTTGEAPCEFKEKGNRDSTPKEQICVFDKIAFIHTVRMIILSRMAILASNFFIHCFILVNTKKLILLKFLKVATEKFLPFSAISFQ
jgi:hypothetical protein